MIFLSIEKNNTHCGYIQHIMSYLHIHPCLNSCSNTQCLGLQSFLGIPVSTTAHRTTQELVPQPIKKQSLPVRHILLIRALHTTTMCATSTEDSLPNRGQACNKHYHQTLLIQINLTTITSTFTFCVPHTCHICNISVLLRCPV